MNRHGKLTSRSFTKTNGTLVESGRMNGKDVALCVKRSAAAAGLDVEKLSTPSLRAGCATQAAKKGIAAGRIQVLGRWKSDTYQRYIRHESCWADAPARTLGL